MAPIKSSLARTVGKLLGISKNTDLSLRGNVQSNRYIETAFVATGGTKITSGSNVYHVFLSSQNFQVDSGTNNIELLVVGGGGATGGTYTGGGGGGGVAHGPSVSISAGTYAVTVGDGGTQQYVHTYSILSNSLQLFTYQLVPCQHIHSRSTAGTCYR